MKRCILLALALVPFLHGQGLLRNSGFSELAEEGKWPLGWECARGGALYSASNVDGLDSNDSLRYAAEEAGSECGPVTQSFVCEPNTQYVLLAGLKGDGKTRPQVVVTAEGVAGIVARVETDSGAWQRLRAVFNSGAAREFQVGMYGDASIVKSARSVVGAAGFDAVQIYRADQEPKATAPAVPFVAPGPNIALKKPYTLKPRPGYSYCTDPDDKTQLTDGAYTVGYFWTQKSTVGWSRAYPAIVTIDLGQIEPVAGVSLSTAAGVAGVAWPESAFILLSDDGSNWRMVGDLVGLSTKHGLPLADKYSTHRFATGELKACGRYVQLVVAQSPYCFMDEIEIYRGADEWRALPPQGKPVGDADAFFRESKVLSSIRWRLQADLDAARSAIREAALPGAESAALLARADALGVRVQSLPQEVPESFRTVLPLSPLHAEIYALNAALLRARGFRGLSTWSASRWDPMQPTDAPAAPGKADALRIDLMRGEVRAEAVNLLNATDAVMDVSLRLVDFPAELPITVHDVLFTDTRSRTPIAAALPEAAANANGYAVSVLAGCSKQIWFSVEKPGKPLAGEYRGSVHLQAGDWSENVPLTIRVADLDFPAQATMSFGGWDYTNGNAGYYRAPGNVDELVPMLREYHVDTPWATNAVSPKGAEFDDAGNLTNPLELDFGNWDEWVERWKGVRNYYVFLSYGGTFHSEKLGTPRFNRMVGAYFTAWVEHMAEQGLKPSQLGVLILDEPHRNEQDEIIIPWAKAIRAAQPQIDIFEDPTYRDPKEGLPEMFEVCTTLCPNTPMMLAQGDSFREFYEAQRKAGRRLWLYSCSGPAKLLDPIAYHRAQKWWAMRVGATGSFYWALGCAGGSGNSWNAYAQTGVEYSPFFVAPTSVMTGKHMEAIREGIQDFEYFVMLRERVRALAARGVPAERLVKARRLLAEAPVQVTTAIEPGSLNWSVKKDRTLMDRLRVQMLDELAALK